MIFLLGAHFPQKQPQNESNPAFGFALEFQVVQAVPNSA